MVAVNYVIATVLTLIFLQPKMNPLSGQFVGLWVILGILLPTIFIAMGRAVAVAGIIKSDAAQRLSLFLPVLAAFTCSVNPWWHIACWVCSRRCWLWFVCCINPHNTKPHRMASGGCWRCGWATAQLTSYSNNCPNKVPHFQAAY